MLTDKERKLILQELSGEATQTMIAEIYHAGRFLGRLYS